MGWRGEYEDRYTVTCKSCGHEVIDPNKFDGFAEEEPCKKCGQTPGDIQDFLDQQMEEIDQMLEDSAREHPLGKFTDHRMRLLIESALNKLGNKLDRESYELLQHHAGCEDPYLRCNGALQDNKLIFEIRSEKDSAKFVLAWKRLEDEVQS